MYCAESKQSINAKHRVQKKHIYLYMYTLYNLFIVTFCWWMSVPGKKTITAHNNTSYIT